MAPARAAQRDDQGAGHRGRGPGDRGADRARRQRQRHAAVLRRALRAGDRGLPAPASSGGSRRGEPVDAIASVASFFVSRVDAKADALLPAGSPLRGQRRDRQRPAAPTGATATRFAGERWQALRDAGASAAASAVGEHRHQGPRLLRRALRRAADRARTSSTRCPRRRCAPSPTTATSGHALDAGPPRPRRSRAAAEAGVDLDAITAELEREGVESFCDSYGELLDCIERKLAAWRPEPVTPPAVLRRRAAAGRA